VLMRVDPPWSGPERESLIGWLQYHRDTLAMKCDGVSPEQLCERSVPPSSMSLIGLVRHMAEVERSWLSRFVVAGGDFDAVPYLYCNNDDNLDGDFDDVHPSTVAIDFETWRAEMDTSDAIIAGADLDTSQYHPRWEATISVRWVIVHLIEEYARHNGHADLIRECVDGATGD
jgi:uncharacterized damage-inducible protein DinB